MNTQDEEDKDTNHGCFSKLSNIENYVRNCIINIYLRIKKFNPILKSKDLSLHEFQEKSRKKDIIEK